MALNAKHHFEAACQGATFLAEELRKYAGICAQYLRKSLSSREELKTKILDAYTALLQYAAELKKLGNQRFLGTDFNPPSIAITQAIGDLLTPISI
jgi:hypothetical protein